MEREIHPQRSKEIELLPKSLEKRQNRQIRWKIILPTTNLILDFPDQVRNKNNVGMGSETVRVFRKLI